MRPWPAFLSLSMVILHHHKLVSCLLIGLLEMSSHYVVLAGTELAIKKKLA